MKDQLVSQRLQTRVVLNRRPIYYKLIRFLSKPLTASLPIFVAMNIRKVVGDNLRDIRQLRGYSQRDLAKLAGRHVVYISSLERGERNITIENLSVIAKALRLPPHLLLVEDAFKAR